MQDPFPVSCFRDENYRASRGQMRPRILICIGREHFFRGRFSYVGEGLGSLRLGGEAPGSSCPGAKRQLRGNNVHKPPTSRSFRRIHAEKWTSGALLVRAEREGAGGSSPPAPSGIALHASEQRPPSAQRAAPSERRQARLVLGIGLPVADVDDSLLAVLVSGKRVGLAACSSCGCEPLARGSRRIVDIAEAQRAVRAR